MSISIFLQADTPNAFERYLWKREVTSKRKKNARRRPLEQGSTTRITAMSYAAILLYREVNWGSDKLSSVSQTPKGQRQNQSPGLWPLCWGTFHTTLLMLGSVNFTRTGSVYFLSLFCVCQFACHPHLIPCIDSICPFPKLPTQNNT